MAYTNPNTAFGFRPVMRIGGTSFSTTEYGKPSTDPNTRFMFDLVIRVQNAVALPESTAAQGYNAPKSPR